MAIAYGDTWSINASLMAYGTYMGQMTYKGHMSYKGHTLRYIVHQCFSYGIRDIYGTDDISGTYLGHMTYEGHTLRYIGTDFAGSPPFLRAEAALL
jgi:hypothetical protein